MFYFFTIFKGCMFIDSTNYKSHVQALIAENDKLKIAVAFWGAGAEALLESKNRKFKIICNLTSGGTNPEVIKKLLKWAPRVSVRHHDDLHAKVFVGHSSAIIGSANMSTNGLNIESVEFDGWQEAGFLTDQVDAVEAAGKWFDTRWEESDEISKTMLKVADLAWQKRISARVRRPKSSPSLLDMTPAEASGRKIFVAFYDEDSSPAAEKVDAKLRKIEPDVFTELSYFEDGHDMADRDELISVRINDGMLSVDGIYQVVPITIERTTRGKNIYLQYVREANHIDGLRLTEKDKKMFGKRLLALLPEIEKLSSWYIPFSNVLEMLKKIE